MSAWLCMAMGWAAVLAATCMNIWLRRTLAPRAAGAFGWDYFFSFLFFVYPWVWFLHLTRSFVGPLTLSSNHVLQTKLGSVVLYPLSL